MQFGDDHRSNSPSRADAGRWLTAAHEDIDCDDLSRLPQIDTRRACFLSR